MCVVVVHVDDVRRKKKGRDNFTQIVMKEPEFEDHGNDDDIREEKDRKKEKERKRFRIKSYSFLKCSACLLLSPCFLQ